MTGFCGGRSILGLTGRRAGAHRCAPPSLCAPLCRCGNAAVSLQNARCGVLPTGDRYLLCRNVKSLVRRFRGIVARHLLRRAFPVRFPRRLWGAVAAPETQKGPAQGICTGQKESRPRGAAGGYERRAISISAHGRNSSTYNSHMMITSRT